MTAINPANMRNTWMVSVQTTALIPPCWSFSQGWEKKNKIKSWEQTVTCDSFRRWEAIALPFQIVYLCPPSRGNASLNEIQLWHWIYARAYRMTQTKIIMKSLKWFKFNGSPVCPLFLSLSLSPLCVSCTRHLCRLHVQLSAHYHMQLTALITDKNKQSVD